MKKFIKWLAKSSVNPQEVSLTVKGALLGIIPVLLMYAQFAGLEWSQDQLASLVQIITAIVSTFLTLVGLIRKVYLTTKNMVQ